MFDVVVLKHDFEGIPAGNKVTALEVYKGACEVEFVAEPITIGLLAVPFEALTAVWKTPASDA